MYIIWYLISLLIILSYISVNVKNIKIKEIVILGYIYLIYIQTTIAQIEHALLLKIINIMTILLVIYLIIKKNENEEYLLIFLAIIGLYTLIESTNFFTLFLALELQAFVGYTLVRNKYSLLSAEAALKYFLIGTIASALFILGVVLIYGQLGVIDYVTISTLNYNNNIVIAGITLITIALIFKIGAAPFHLWLPDAYAGASYETLLFISIFPKIFLFVLIKSLYTFIETNLVIIISIVLSLLIGSIQAVKQQKIKRFISYTIIYNNGFFLTLMLLPSAHSDYIQALALIFYLISSFLILLLFINFKTLNGTTAFQNIRDLLLILNSNYFYMLPLTVAFFALIGIPPMSNFFFKTIILSELLDKEQLILTIILIMMSILPSFYYLRIITILHFQTNTKRIFFQEISNSNTQIISLLSIIIFCSLLFFNELIQNITL